MLDASTLLESRAQPRIKSVGQCVDGSYGIAHERRAVHQSKRPRLEASEPSNGRGGCGAETSKREEILCFHSRLNDVGCSQCRAITQSGEKITTEKRLGRLLKNDSSIPPMGHVGGIDISDFPASDIDNLSVCKHSWRTIGPVSDG